MTLQVRLKAASVGCNNAVAIRDGVKICLLMCNGTVSLVGLVGWQTMLLVYAAGQIRDKRTDEQDLTGQDAAGAAAFYFLRTSKK